MTFNPEKSFYYLLANHLVADTTNYFVWFALTFWVFLETGSVLATSFIAGFFAVANMFGAFIFGSVVDHNRKKTAMVYSSIMSLISFSLGTIFYFSVPEGTFTDTRSLFLWALIAILMIGTVAGNLRTIALSTAVTLLFSEDRDKVNGLIGMTKGMAFALTSVLSGVTIGFYGMGTALLAATAATLIALLHLLTISIPEPEIIHTEEDPRRMDLRGTIAIVLAIPGLLGLIIFNTFNNFLGGVFMALLDPYGLTLVSVETWGFMWGAMSVAIIFSSAYIAKYGIGKQPIRLILILNVISWLSCIIFPIQASVILLGLGMFVWMVTFPIIEAAEQTVIQNIVPYKRQGRVFGFANSVESAASPIVVFMIGPLAHFFFIPFMTTGQGVTLIGDWFGTGVDRGIALVFILAGLIGLVVTLLAFTTKSYRLLSLHYANTQTQKTP
jgi:DHA3 family multidrug efflux protein-like MFS transporter